MKKSVGVFVVLAIISIIGISVASAGWFNNLFNSGDDEGLEGELGESATAKVEIKDVSPPKIIFVSDVDDNNPGSTVFNHVLPFLKSTPDVKVVFSFLAQQGGEQAGDLYTSGIHSAARFYRASSLLRHNITCITLGVVDLGGGKSAVNHSCTIYMRYYDDPGTWNIEVNVTDKNSNIGFNLTKTFIVDELDGAKSDINYLNWTNPTLTTAVQNRRSDNLYMINSTGNVDMTRTAITASWLNGSIDITKGIPPAKFKVNNSEVCGSGTPLDINSINVPSFNIPKAVSDVGSGAILPFCISDLSGQILPSQVYKTTTDWTINFYKI